MSFEFDAGAGGSEGPWLQWSARGTQDGEIPPKTFFMRTKEDGKEVFTGFNRGVVLDVHNMKTGWCYSDGVSGKAPDWKWNTSVSHFDPKPAEEYKKGFQIPCAIGSGKTATWEQAGAGAWNAFVNLVPHIQTGPVDQGKLPMVRMTGSKLEKFARGTTTTPILEIVQWVDRPACLTASASNIDTGGDVPDAAPKKTVKASVPADIGEF